MRYSIWGANAQFGGGDLSPKPLPGYDSATINRNKKYTFLVSGIHNTIVFVAIKSSGGAASCPDRSCARPLKK